ncbi:hypothetical protein OROHE_018971 [Orobanche hederae]
MQDLMKLERLIEIASSRVAKAKTRKEAELVDENAWLKQRAAAYKVGCRRNAIEQGSSTESIINSHGLVHDNINTSDTSLKLGTYLSPAVTEER